jgi:hypothetical protein
MAHDSIETGVSLFTNPTFFSETRLPLMVRVIPSWIEVGVYMASAVLCFGAALTTPVKDEDYGLLLVGIACLVATFGARKIVGVRDQTNVPEWLKFRWSDTVDEQGTKTPGDLLENRRTKFQAQEMAVDIYRTVVSIIVVPLVLFRCYQMTGTTGTLFEGKGVVTALAVSALVCNAVMRIGTDELTPNSTDAPGSRVCGGFVQFFGWILFGGAIAVYVLLMVDLLNAVEKSTLDSKTGASYVAYVSIGYPSIALVSILWRQIRGPGNYVTAANPSSVSESSVKDNGYSEALSVLKDVVYTGLGVAILGFLGFGSAFDVLDQPFLNTTFFR